MDMVALAAAARGSGVSAKQLRLQGVVPAVVYGNVENTLIQCGEKDVRKAFMKAGESTLVELDVGGKKIPVLFHVIDFHPVSDRISHVDFYAVDMKKEVEATVHVELVGESPAVKDSAAILITPLDRVTVKCLPSKLPHSLKLSIEKLTEFGSTLTVADLDLPEGVGVLEGPETVLALAQEPREEEVEAPPVAAEGAVEGAAAEGAAPAEGEAAPAAEEKKE